jgi:hypothetical protein
MIRAQSQLARENGPIRSGQCATHMNDPELVALLIKTICVQQMHADDCVLHPLSIQTTRRAPLWLPGGQPGLDLWGRKEKDGGTVLQEKGRGGGRHKNFMAA